ncbi:MAG: CRISPR-associated protein Csx15 [Gemmataceae bacterium]
MLLLNFGHPLTEIQLARIAEIAGQPIERVLPVATQFDHARPFPDQVRQLLATVPLTAEQWQTTPLLVNSPTFAPIAAVLIAELHGRMGYFPMLIRLRPIIGVVPPQFEVAELLNLQAVRDTARAGR